MPENKIAIFATNSVMGTFLFDEIIFGPVRSRRLGMSLGVNLLPVDSKVCTFDCLYCECGRTKSNPITSSKLPTRQQVKDQLREKLTEMKKDNLLPDVITYAGNGEPTMHPDFAKIVDDTITLRDELCRNARIAVLSNSTLIHKPKVFHALTKIDDNILKLDSAFEETIELMDCPLGGFSLTKVVENLKKFNGKLTIQTMFVKGEYKDKSIDNTTEKEVNAWIGLLKIINPERVMIYTIARDTPVKSLQKISLAKLKEIASKVESEGFPVQVSE